jgi:hypothetical protein
MGEVLRHRVGFGAGFIALALGGSGRTDLSETPRAHGFWGPTLSVSIDREFAPWVSVGGFLKAEWPDVACTAPELEDDCTFDMYYTLDAGVVLAAVPRVELRFYTADSGLAVYTGLGFGLAATVSGVGDDTSVHIGYLAHLDVGVSVPVAPRWAAQFRIIASLLRTEHVSCISCPTQAQNIVEYFASMLPTASLWVE